MPMVQVKLIEGVFTDSQKQEMIRKITDAMVSIEGEAMREVTWVLIEEVKSGNWAIGGKALTAAAVRDMAIGGGIAIERQDSKPLEVAIARRSGH